MNDTTKILTIQDISCYGQCSITVALPVISTFGIETAVLPSAVKPDGLVFVDPAMADHGEFYNGFDQDFADSMGELCKLGDYILPNTTEACYILHKPWKEEFSNEEMLQMAEELSNYLKDIDIKVAYLHNEIKTLERLRIINEIFLMILFAYQTLKNITDTM